MSMIPRFVPFLMLTAAVTAVVPAVVPAVLPAALAAGVLPAPPMPVGGEAPSAAFFDTLRSADLRLATIAYRLTTANAALCDRLQPQVGMPIHALTQYGPDARKGATATFGFESTIGVEAVVAGGPADRAGVRPNDSIVAIDDRPQPGLPSADAPESATARDAAEAVVTEAPVGRPLRLTVLRDGKRLPITITPVTGCRSRFEILLGSGLDASADGAIV
ncbi:MAG: PDZ domain-containing protein, partial [Sphingomonas sp.]